MPRSTSNYHFDPSEEMAFSFCSHATNDRSINIGAQEYGGVSLFINLEQAKRIAEYFAGLVVEWSETMALQGAPDGETPQADEKPGPDYELQGKEF